MWLILISIFICFLCCLNDAVFAFHFHFLDCATKYLFTCLSLFFLSTFCSTWNLVILIFFAESWYIFRRSVLLRQHLFHIGILCLFLNNLFWCLWNVILGLFIFSRQKCFEIWKRLRVCGVLCIIDVLSTESYDK